MEQVIHLWSLQQLGFANFVWPSGWVKENRPVVIDLAACSTCSCPNIVVSWCKLQANKFLGSENIFARLVFWSFGPPGLLHPHSFFLGRGPEHPVYICMQYAPNRCAVCMHGLRSCSQCTCAWRVEGGVSTCISLATTNADCQVDLFVAVRQFQVDVGQVQKQLGNQSFPVRCLCQIVQTCRQYRNRNRAPACHFRFASIHRDNWMVITCRHHGFWLDILLILD